MGFIKSALIKGQIQKEDDSKWEDVPPLVDDNSDEEDWEEALPDPKSTTEVAYELYKSLTRKQRALIHQM